MKSLYFSFRFWTLWLTIPILVHQDSLSQESTDRDAATRGFHAGAAVVDISPTSFPVRVAGYFLESQANQLRDPLFARAIVIENDSTKIAMVIVDTCMMTQSLIDEAKQTASLATGMPINHIMVSATHTHSAPAAMGCLGTRQDKAYAAWLPGKIAEAIVAANSKLQPARIGWETIDDWQHTHNRRWIRKPESKVVDPFGDATGLANMHPGYLSPAIVGPSGPVDPTLSVLSLQTRDGRPLAVLANYSQHYYGAAALSADYFGLFCKHVAAIVGEPGDGNGPFVAAISQGTSGDLMWMDYGSAEKARKIDRYAEEVAKYAEIALAKIQYKDTVPLRMSEKNITLNYRVPNEERLEWARSLASKIQDELPKSIPEVYAMEALILHQRQKTNVKLQAIRIGDLTIATLPNEVYALTGLKLRGRTPSSSHFNIELANGAEGYIPPSEQHALGGYTTWPARTAGLEVQAEKKIVDSLVEALEEVTGQSRRTMQDAQGPYAQAILAAKPISFWRLNDEEGDRVRNAVPGGQPARLSPGFALYLPGVGSGTGVGLGEQLIPSEFSGPTQINRAIHFAGGNISVDSAGLDKTYSFAFWFWLGERSGASERSGTLCIGPAGETVIAKQTADHLVQLQVGDSISAGKWRCDDWNFAVVIREKSKLSIHVNGATQPALEASVKEPAEQTTRLQFWASIQGKLDEIAVFDRVLTTTEIGHFWNTSKISEQLASEQARAKVLSESQPLSVEESLAKIHVPRGFRVEVVAAEPETIDPVAFDWDELGRLWIVEMSDYPLGMDGKGKAGGRVRVLEDRDHDGRFETSRLFADGLRFPNGILTWRDGVLVTAAPEILFLRDGDGDGIADQKEVLFSGFNEGNQQLRMNHLRWGLDNWVYCANGGHAANYGMATKVTSHRKGQSYQLGSRDFRFQPDTGNLELESGPSQYGRNRDAWGHWFGTQNTNPLWQYVLSDRYLARNPHVPTPSPIKHIVGPGSPIVYPASQLEKRFHSFDQSGRFTSACSGMIYNDELLFGRSALTHAFTCEPFHNLVQHNVLFDNGISFKARRPVGEGQTDFFASEDRWCRPVMVRTGPDGGLWVADMYRYMIEHPDWLPPDGKAELLPHYRLGDDRGRIYRVVPVAVSPSRKVTLDQADTVRLVAALESSNDWQRDKAHQLLLWKHDLSAVPLLENLARTGQLPQTRLQALCVLDGMNALTHSSIVTALQDHHPRVRENALRLAEHHESSEVVETAVELAQDKDAKVCLQLALSLGEWKSPLATHALAELAVRFANEPFVLSAIMSSALPHSPEFLKELVTRDPSVLTEFRIPLLRQAMGARDSVSIEVLMQSVLSAGYATRQQAADEFLLSLQRIGTDVHQLAKLDSEGNLATVVKQFDVLLVDAEKEAKDTRRPVADRIAAARILCRPAKYREMGVDLLAQWLQPQIDPLLQSQAMDAISQSGIDKVPSVLSAAWPQLSPVLRGLALDAWLSRETWTGDLLDRLQSSHIEIRSLDLTQRARLLQHPNKSLAQRAKSILETAGKSSRKQILEQYFPALKLPGNVPEGQLVYKRACANCHRRGNEGQDVGPNLATVVEHSNEKLLTNILDPNADIQPGYQAYTVLLDGGEILSGLLFHETANSITIKQANGVARTISRDEIERLQNSKVSLMPEGMEALMTQQDVADLLAFLHSPIHTDKQP